MNDRRTAESSWHVFIVCDYSLDYVGGAQTALIRQAQALRSQGCAVTVLAPGSGGGLRGSGIRILTPETGPVIPGVGLPFLRARRIHRTWMRRVLRARRPDLIIAHSELALATTAAREARSLGIPVFHTVHTFFWAAPAYVQWAGCAIDAFYALLTGMRSPRVSLAPGGADSALRNMTLAMARLADVVLSPSNHQAEALRGAGLDRVVALSNVVESVEGAQPLWASDTRRVLRLGWVGRFAPEKRLETALEGVQMARRRGVPVELTIGGGGAPAKWEGEDWAHFEGRLSQDAVGALIASVDCMMLSSLGFDNQPMVVLEAAARGRTTIVSDPVLGIEFGPAVISAPGTDARGICAAIERVWHRPQLLAEAGGAALHYAHSNDARAHVGTLRELCRSVRRS